MMIEETMEDGDPIEQMFAERVCNPLAWFHHSRSLIAAARATIERANVLIDFHEKSDLENVAAMLYGFSLENLFKALWILNKYGAPHAQEWVPEAKFPKELKTHDLVSLAHLAGIKLTEEYKDSLSILSDVTTWSGRYPCSLKGDEGGIGRYPFANEHADLIFKRHSRQFTSIS